MKLPFRTGHFVQKRVFEKVLFVTRKRFEFRFVYCHITSHILIQHSVHQWLIAMENNRMYEHRQRCYDKQLDTHTSLSQPST